MPTEMKDCPICGESILAVARKCRYCGEYLDAKAKPGPPPKLGLAKVAGSCALLSLFPCLGIPFGIAAAICGGLAFRTLKANPHMEGKVDAWQGVLIGGGSALVQLAVLAASLIAAHMNK